MGHREEDSPFLELEPQPDGEVGRTWQGQLQGR
jgi:hypothetical protein